MIFQFGQKVENHKYFCNRLLLVCLVQSLHWNTFDCFLMAVTRLMPSGGAGGSERQEIAGELSVIPHVLCVEKTDIAQNKKCSDLGPFVYWICNLGKSAETL